MKGGRVPVIVAGFVYWRSRLLWNATAAARSATNSIDGFEYLVVFFGKLGMECCNLFGDGFLDQLQTRPHKANHPGRLAWQRRNKRRIDFCRLQGLKELSRRPGAMATNCLTREGTANPHHFQIAGG
jgi:hypothetical protein